METKTTLEEMAGKFRTADEKTCGMLRKTREIIEEEQRDIQHMIRTKRFKETIPRLTKLINLARDFDRYREIFDDSLRFLAQLYFDRGECYAGTNQRQEAIENYNKTIDICETLDREITIGSYHRPFPHKLAFDAHLKIATLVKDRGYARKHLDKACNLTWALPRNVWDNIQEIERERELERKPQTLAEAQMLRWRLYGQKPCE